jgi:hypothetical protein
MRNKFHELIEMSFGGYAGIESPPAKQTIDAEHTISNYIKDTVIWTQKGIHSQKLKGKRKKFGETLHVL